MKLTLRKLILLVLGAAVAGALVFWLGLFNIAASPGHWAITDWVLHTAMRRSVKFHADAEPPEDYPTPAMVRRGAGHYESGCAPCHGSPAAGRGAVVKRMTPPPPVLDERIADWQPEELFWIVKHGVIFTGMPAWPSIDRDDEVWSVVAFLERLPSLGDAEYRELAYGPRQDADDEARRLSVASVPALDDCVRCHGLDGRGEPNGAFPRLDIQTPDYLLEALEAYASGERPSGMMQAAVMGLHEDDLRSLADHYGQADGPPPDLPAETIPAELIDRGREIAESGLAGDNVAACSGCHGAEATGTERESFPRLSGQYYGYLVVQLQLYAEDKRGGGGRFAELMQEASHKLAADDINAVAAWYASRPPVGGARAAQ